MRAIVGKGKIMSSFISAVRASASFRLPREMYTA